MKRDCIHGQLARSCEICERDAEIARMRPVIRAARRVVWYDWSENDSDAVAAIETLRRAVAKAKGE